MRPWLTIEGRTDDILCFENGIRIAPMLLYAVLKEVHCIERFQLIQQEDDRLELRLIADNKQEIFKVAKKAVENYLSQKSVLTDVYLSEKLPEANPVSGKYKHIIAKEVTTLMYKILKSPYHSANVNENGKELLRIP